MLIHIIYQIMYKISTLNSLVIKSYINIFSILKMVSLANLSFDNFHYPRVNFVNQFVSYFKNILAGFNDLVLQIFGFWSLVPWYNGSWIRVFLTGISSASLHLLVIKITTLTGKLLTYLDKLRWDLTSNIFLKNLKWFVVGKLIKPNWPHK
jgi:hypothetical protein